MWFKKIPEDVQEFKTENWFNNNPNYEIVGYPAGKPKEVYIRCRVCCLDIELFGEAIFSCHRSNLKRNNVACGCAKNFKYSEEQVRIIAQREAEKRGYKFKDFAEPFDKRRVAHIKCIFVCQKHGEWSTTTFSSFTKGTGCTGCQADFISALRIKPDNVMIDSFFKSGKYPEGTIFKRSERKNKRGHQAYWEIYCPICQTKAVAHYGSLQKGIISCNCKLKDQVYCYLGVISDNGNPIALKFGITRNFKVRQSSTIKKTKYEYKIVKVWQFMSREDTRLAEKTLKSMLVTGVINKTDMVGYTETTYLSNIEIIEKVYEEFGGNLYFQSE